MTGIEGISYDATVVICADCMTDKERELIKSEEDMELESVTILTEESLRDWDAPVICDTCRAVLRVCDHEISYFATALVKGTETRTGEDDGISVREVDMSTADIHCAYCSENDYYKIVDDWTSLSEEEGQ